MKWGFGMLKFTSLLLLLTLLTASVCGCADIKPLNTVEPYTAPDKLTDGFDAQPLKDFAYGTFSEVIKGDGGKSSLYSPVSLFTALSLASGGARGETSAQLLDLLGFESTAELESYMPLMFQRIIENREHSVSSPALSLWLDDGFKSSVKSDFLTRASKLFGAEVFAADFADPNTGKSMERWVYDMTGGMLEPTVSLDGDMLMSIISTLYFSDEWQIKFEESDTKPDKFHLADGSEITLDFMNNLFDTHSYTVGDGFCRSSLGLKSSGSLVIVLPDKELGIDGLLEKQSIAEIFEGGEHKSGEVIFKLPKFDFNVKYELKEMMKTLGVTDMFSNNADFSGITEEPLFASSVIQENRAAIDEKGISAASFTQIIFYGAALPDGSCEMICDRPFLFMIKNRFGVPLFMGIYTGK